MVMVDTDILIWILRGKPLIKEKFKQIHDLSKGELFISAIQWAEIYAGLKDNEAPPAEVFLESFNAISFLPTHGKMAGGFLKRYKKSHGICLADALIAAMVKTNGLQLWTLNKKHYPMLSDGDFCD